MALQQYSLDPVDGLRNKTIFKTDPGSEDALRADIQTPIDQTMQAVNDLTAKLSSISENDSGANQVGFSPVSGIDGEDVQRAIESVFSQVRYASVGQIPNASISEEKLNFDVAKLEGGKLDISTIPTSDSETENSAESVATSKAVYNVSRRTYPVVVSSGTANLLEVDSAEIPTDTDGLFDNTSFKLRSHVDIAANASLRVGNLSPIGLYTGDGNRIKSGMVKAGSDIIVSYNLSLDRFTIIGAAGIDLTETHGEISQLSTKIDAVEDIAQSAQGGVDAINNSLLNFTAANALKVGGLNIIVQPKIYPRSEPNTLYFLY